MNSATVRQLDIKGEFFIYVQLNYCIMAKKVLKKFRSTNTLYEDYSMDIANWHKERKISATGGTYCGYHYVIDLDGTIEIGEADRPCRLSLQGIECGQHRHLLHRRPRREGRPLRHEDV